MTSMTNTHLAALSFPFRLVFDDLREAEPLTALLRRPEFVSLDAAVSFDKLEEPDFASNARTAGIPMEPLGAVRSFLRTVDRMMSEFEDSSFDLFFPFVCGLSSSENPMIASESELSNSRGSESSSRGLLMALWVVIEMKSGGMKRVLVKRE